MTGIGILDPSGNKPNPLTNKPYSDKYKELSKFWAKLPVYSQATDIIKKLNNNQVILLKSSTGSGKSVIVPKLVLHVFDYKGKVVMTLPKQIIAKSSAEYAAATMDVAIGQEIGYQYKNSPKNAKSDQTVLLYATDGTIVQKILKDPYLREYSAIVLDEIHERSMRIDFLLYLLRSTLLLRPDFKVVLMSATIDSRIFQQYFSKFKFIEINVGGERKYPIDSVFLDRNLSYDAAMEIGFRKLTDILESTSQEKDSDILFFITSSNEAFTLCKKLNTYISKETPDTCKISCKGNIFCVEVYSGMDPMKQDIAIDRNKFKEQNNNYRKVVFSTNVAESSLTIDGIKYVIDPGFELSSYYDAVLGARVLKKQYISNAQARQRMGRAGRTGPGICHHLYTKETFETKMHPYPEPEIRTSDITTECLRLLETAKTTDNLIHTLSNFIEPPRENYIRDAINNLQNVGALEDNNITPLGEVMSKYSTEPHTTQSIILAKQYGCSQEVMKIIAICEIIKNNVNEVFLLPQTLLQNKKGASNYESELKRLTEKFNASKRKYNHKTGDHLSLLKLFDTFEKHNTGDMEKTKDWCYDHYLKFDTLLKIRKHYKRMRGSFHDLVYEKKFMEMKLEDRVLFCLSYYNTAVKTNKNYKTPHADNVTISKSSFLNFNDTLPKDVFYNELLIMEDKTELNIVSKKIEKNNA